MTKRSVFRRLRPARPARRYRGRWSQPTGSSELGRVQHELAIIVERRAER